MKVLIEKLNNRKGYKFFENREEMDAYLGRHCNKIASYEILQEDDVNSTNDILQSLAEECEVLENKLFYIFRQQEKIKKAKQYEKLIYAAGRLREANATIRGCII